MLGNKPLFDKLFPEIKGILWCEVFMDAAFRERPYLDPKKPTDQAYLAPLYTYGGFKEDRSNIWSGFEPSDTMIHLGLDIQVKADTQVASLTNGTILDILEDSAKFNGWGTKIIVETSLRQNNKTKKYYVLYGHLYKPSVKIGQEVKQGELLGLIAPPEYNGGWFEHLHLQVMDESLNVPIREVDGYEFKKNSITGVINPFEFYEQIKN
jgi:murein DD-endopeptidase MepM/ murein hydrolase activator NlpD